MSLPRIFSWTFFRIATFRKLLLPEKLIEKLFWTVHYCCKVHCGFGHITEEILNGKLDFLCSARCLRDSWLCLLEAAVHRRSVKSFYLLYKNALYIRCLCDNYLKMFGITFPRNYNELFLPDTSHWAYNFSNVQPHTLFPVLFWRPNVIYLFYFPLSLWSWNAIALGLTK